MTLIFFTVVPSALNSSGLYLEKEGSLCLAGCSTDKKLLHFTAGGTVKLILEHDIMQVSRHLNTQSSHCNEVLLYLAISLQICTFTYL